MISVAKGAAPAFAAALGATLLMAAPVDALVVIEQLRAGRGPPPPLRGEASQPAKKAWVQAIPTLITTFPLACPSSRYRIASGTSLNV